VLQQELHVAKGVTGFVEPKEARNINKASNYSAWPSVHATRQ